MVGKTAVRMIKQMTREELIDVSQQEHYVYALITIMESAITISVIFGISLLAKKVVPTAVFLFFFLALRKRTGGYHMWSFGKCLWGTIGIYLMILGGISDLVKIPQVLFGLLAVAACLIEWIGTVNHPNMDYDDQELREMKKSARLMTALEVCIIAFCYILKVDMLLIGYMSCGIILCAILVCIAKLSGQEVRKR